MFSEGLAPVRAGAKFGYSDVKGDTVIAPQFDFAARFAEGLAAAGIGSKQGYIDKNGMFVLVPQFEIADLAVFSEGLAAVRIGEFIAGKWGYMNKSGKVVIQPQFDAAGPFSDGLAVVANGGKWGYIDKSGNLVIPLQYASGSSFGDGLAAVKTGDLAGARKDIQRLSAIQGSLLEQKIAYWATVVEVQRRSATAWLALLSDPRAMPSPTSPAG